jgi:hypothetical protein
MSVSVEYSIVAGLLCLFLFFFLYLFFDDAMIDRGCISSSGSRGVIVFVSREGVGLFTVVTF